MRSLIAALAFALIPAGFAQADELDMFQLKGCPYCRAWNSACFTSNLWYADLIDLEFLADHSFLDAALNNNYTFFSAAAIGVDRASRKLYTTKKKVRSFEGGVFVQTVPGGNYRCRPAPYERACMIAAFFKKNKMKDSSSASVRNASRCSTSCSNLPAAKPCSRASKRASASAFSPIEPRRARSQPAPSRSSISRTSI